MKEYESKPGSKCASVKEPAIIHYSEQFDLCQGHSSKSLTTWSRCLLFAANVHNNYAFIKYHQYELGINLRVMGITFIFFIWRLVIKNLDGSPWRVTKQIAPSSLELCQGHNSTHIDKSKKIYHFYVQQLRNTRSLSFFFLNQGQWIYWLSMFKGLTLHLKCCRVEGAAC